MKVGEPPCKASLQRFHECAPPIESSNQLRLAKFAARPEILATASRGFLSVMIRQLNRTIHCHRLLQPPTLS